jgi:sugar/nucleoside kinase (ribokinase family)
MTSKNKQISVCGLGNPLMDIITHVTDSYLSEYDIKPHTMNLIDGETFEKIYGKLPQSSLLPGGSCANTLRGLAFLDTENEFPAPVYIGAVGIDDLGSQYIRAIESAGITSRIIRKTEPTGASIILVTPDSERTMLTNLGACRTITLDDIDISLVVQADVLHITGYQWDTNNQKQIVKRLADTAKDNDVLVSFDLADPFVVTRYKDDFLSWIPGHVDLLFGNYDEYSLLAGIQAEYEKVITAVKDIAGKVIMKVGKKGSYCFADNKLLYSKGFQVKAFDTTGAGDAYAGGFLYGVLKGFSLQACCDAANKLASQIVTVQGCDYNKIGS